MALGQGIEGASVEKLQPRRTIDNIGTVVQDKSMKALVPEMVFVKGGSFWMGSDSTDIAAKPDEFPKHYVEVEDFYMGKYEVTVEEFARFVEASGYKSEAEKTWGSSICGLDGSIDRDSTVNWRYDAKGDIRPFEEYRHPVIHVSWNDAVAYCKWLSEETGLQYRLPTEEEWEYAARSGGKSYRYAWEPGEVSGNIVDESAKAQFSGWAIWEGYTDGYIYTSPVGIYRANELGIYDMAGNVWEWCSSEYISYGKDRSIYSDDFNKVLRGGSWYRSVASLRVASRCFIWPSNRNGSVGFRLARTP